MTHQARFISLMNTSKFQITALQLRLLEATTRSIIGCDRVSVFALKDVNETTGLAKFVVDGIEYQAARLRSNGRWYLTGDYTFL